MEKKLKVILIALIVILLTLISFVGIYTKKSNVYKNIITDYLFSKNLKGSRVIQLSIDTSTKKVTYDENGNIVDKNDEDVSKEKTENDSESTENTESSNYKTVEEPINSQDTLNEENYKIVKKILEKRLNTLNIVDFNVKLNKSNGNIIVEIPEDSQTDDTKSYLTSIGSFEIIDSEDKSLLLDNNDIEKAHVAYNTDTNGTSVYLTIKFNKEGKKKIEDVSNKYIMTTDEEDKTTEKKITLKMEGEDILSTYFSEPITNGEIQLTVGTTSNDVSKVQEYLKNAAGVAMLLNSGKMPITYKIESEQYVKPIVNDTILSISIYVLLGIAIISYIYIAIKYKKYGFLAIISSIASVDLLLIVIRYTNVTLSIESAIGFIVLIILNIYIVNNLIKGINKNYNEEEIKKQIKNGLLKSIDMIVVMLIISVVFTFISWSAISNIGLLMFWGIICILLSHLIFTRALLLNSNK